MRTTLALTLLLTAAAGCDSPDAPKPPAVVLDEEQPCAVATPDEIAAVTGGEPGPVRAGEGHSKDGTLLCNYEVGPPFSSVTVYVDTDVSEDDFRERMERDPLNVDPLDGAGDLAFTRAGVCGRTEPPSPPAFSTSTTPTRPVRRSRAWPS